MDIVCSRCGTIATPAGHEDGRAFYRCEFCNRVWMMDLTSATNGRVEGSATATRVLVVDDSDQLVELVGAWLEEEGYLVETATSGSRAIAAAAAAHPDIVLVDLIPPPPDGFVLCDLLQRGPRPPVVIVITGMTDALRLRRIDELGVFDVLPKPLTQPVVLDAVSRARRWRWEVLPKPATP
jgi:two-component system, OmpR family, KDP operon response regulator KdpE